MNEWTQERETGRRPAGVRDSELKLGGGQLRCSPRHLSELFCQPPEAVNWITSAYLVDSDKKVEKARY